MQRFSSWGIPSRNSTKNGAKIGLPAWPKNSPGTRLPIKLCGIISTMGSKNNNHGLFITKPVGSDFFRLLVIGDLEWLN